jgi:hypothetical protein
MSRLIHSTKNLARNSLLEVRKVHLLIDEHINSMKPKSKKLRLFNLDLHISVMRDLRQELSQRKIKTVCWSISGANRYTRSLYKFSDPVAVVNSSTWSNLDDELISKFESRYAKFLQNFDGFIVTHTPALAQLYRNLGKPILILNSTRYEAPYSNNDGNWKGLDNFLIDSVNRGQILLTSNNAGDADYIRNKTGIHTKIVPSLCDYTRLHWKPKESGRKIVVARSSEVEHMIERETAGDWLGIKKILGENFRWNQYLNIDEVLYIPYNISTMYLFELATAGVPVAVPSKRFLKQMAKVYPGILSELSYFQVHNLSAAGLAHDDPNNYHSETFHDWWLSRADFYNLDLMPNVRVIDSFDELRIKRFATDVDWLEYREKISNRNETLRNVRSDLINTFISKI